MADGRRHSVDIPITRTLIALRRVRSLRDPSTNSMSKFSALLENATWETNSTKEISIQFADVSKEGRLNHTGLSGWKNLGLDEHREEQVDNFDSQYDMGRSELSQSSGGVKSMDAPLRTENVEGDNCEREASGTKLLSEEYYGSHRNKGLDLVCSTPLSNQLEDRDSTSGPVTGSPLGIGHSVPRQKPRSKNQVKSYSGVGDVSSRAGSPCLSVSDALSSHSTSLFPNDEADFMVQNDRGCGISCCWTKTPRLRDSNPYSDAEGSPLLSRDVAETAPRGKRSWKHTTNETPRSLSQKFRPKSFDELVGQNVVVRSLLGAISKGRIASLYLFHGPRGTGKTSASRIFAAALNCLSHEYKPCGVCRECVAFFSGRSRDVKEVDSMRINRAKGIRSLIKNASMPPISSRFKVFIVDECHLLHGETWGTVLNSLENLSQNVVFVMITPELDTLPRSAVSRSQKYHFPKIKDADIAGRLRNICVEEDLDFDQVALDFIAAKSGGSLRDAEIMLDQLSLLGKRITMSLAHELVSALFSCEYLLYISSHRINRSDHVIVRLEWFLMMNCLICWIWLCHLTRQALS